MEKYGFIYIWRDKKHNRYYLGSHWGSEDDGYICSSAWMKNSFKRRPDDFKRRILSRIYTDKRNLLELENKWLKLIKDEELKVKYYNLRNKDFNHWSIDQDLSLSIKEKISIKTKEAMHKPEIREKFLQSVSNRNNKSSDLKVRQKRSESMKKTMAEKFPVENRRVKLTEEERFNYYSNKAKQMHSMMSENKKRTRIEKIVKANIGKKMRLGQKNSPEHERKKKESFLKTAEIKRKQLLQKRILLVLNTIHLTCVDASKSTGIGRCEISRIRKLINNKLI